MVKRDNFRSFLTEATAKLPNRTSLNISRFKTPVPAIIPILCNSPFDAKRFDLAPMGGIRQMMEGVATATPSISTKETRTGPRHKSRLMAQCQTPWWDLTKSRLLKNKIFTMWYKTITDYRCCGHS
ncbi:hypothetical protein CEXT_569021 [Caerostris extrusa]|uniref:Uncharacterized protein n=1 Tax=Caerostris extrusa TaxID=172846 RepID=A0AAV4Y3U4_CAEEX|nr:hypothetical protein CEXT_569021 [Caerostris extrusa]